MSDWDASDEEVTKSGPSVPAAPVAKVVHRSKWEGEDEEDDQVASDWEESSEEEDAAKAAPVVAAAPPKKKGTLKAKLAEKEAAKAAANDDTPYDSDDVLDPREKARRDKEKELQADLNNAADLLGAAALGGTSDKKLDQLITANPRTKEDFETLSNQIYEYVIKRLESKPLYTAFVEHHVRGLASSLKDIEVRKVASVLTTLANEKQKEQRDKTSGKKKPKSAAKPALGGIKVAQKLDINAYEEALDDFGNNADDFM